MKANLILPCENSGMLTVVMLGGKMVTSFSISEWNQ